MTPSVIEEIVRRIDKLPPEDQLMLIEQIAHRLRGAATNQVTDWDNRLAAMAADEDVQKELQAINAGFSAADADGLEGA